MYDTSLEDYLERFFGYNTFRTGQKEIIQSVLFRQHTLAVLPTGTGKSICYQLPALLMKGTVLVISPLLSLMTDQIKELKSFGMKDVVAINSMTSKHEKQYSMKNLNKYKLVFTSPEMLQNSFFITQLKKIDLSLFVIDEAHCISQWGYEFRPDYLRLTDVHKELRSPPVLAVTATATPEVQEDIIDLLELRDCNKYIYPMDKPNLSFVVKKVAEVSEKKKDIVGTLEKYPVPTMIYFSSRKEAENMSAYLQNELADLKTAYYHGAMDTTDRLLIQQQFMANQLDIICCTSAFGMGINKMDVRLVIHYHAPSQLESFIQEVGRAGRDGKESVSLLYFHETDQHISRHLIESELPDISLIENAVKYIIDNRLTEKTSLEDYFLKVSGENEIQWRFFQYQLEVHDIIINDKINVEKININDFVKSIRDTIWERQIYKHKKMYEMVDWINRTNCRRVALYEHFQSGVQQPLGMCCDYCDFKWEYWQPSLIKHKKSYQLWEEKLASKLMQNDY
ncbi:ATP-dependent DNA helicase RecQ [Gracilibacillus ureilyticus]|uniref:ATP-dependent DNA helicase RecQ n=1 Tax=Gracilibacillus ureilyticus TaxID=531814 RepID=A0A1H9LS43_9BACI|nr:ATP-dependent DNA helicase RecQ [Gracilibacillus ureilyticus]SER14089.1 ATP-dependent DNA helicase RecQ [Gracilibacillus ureilyticus]